MPQEGRTSSLLRQAFNLVGQVSPRLDPLVTPVAVVHDLAAIQGRGELEIGNGQATDGVGAQDVMVQLQAPAGFELYVPRAVVSFNAAGTVAMSLDQAAGAGGGTNEVAGRRDTRLAAPAVGQIIASNGAGIFTGSVIGAIRVLADEPFLWPIEAYLAPGTRITFAVLNTAAGNSLRVSPQWNVFASGEDPNPVTP